MNKPVYEGETWRNGWQSRKKKDMPAPRDKMQPSLLDRLTDNHPQQSYDPINSNRITHGALRRSVLRDLQWLFNTINHDNPRTQVSQAHVRCSVVNFGVSPLAGKRMSDIEWQDVQHKLTEAIVSFEPRIQAQGLQVLCLSDPRALNLHNVLSIEIKGRLWSVPYPLEFIFRTDVDLENGHFEIKDVG